ncbi:MAG: hypothetical protein V9G10_06335 [Candidatus Nanopelagicales bacterium]
MSSDDTTPGGNLVGGGLLVAVALGIGQVLAYAQTLVAARTLTPAEFGAFSALLALILIGNTVALATQAVTARHIVATPRSQWPDETAAAWRTATQVALILTAVWLVLAPAITWALRLDSILIAILLALGFLPLTLLGGALGIAQGHERHITLAGVYVALSVPRNGVTIALLIVVATLGSAMFGLAVGGLLSAALAWLLLRSFSRGGHARHTTMLREVPAATYSLLALFTLTNLDIVLGRAFLSPGGGRAVRGGHHRRQDRDLAAAVRRGHGLRPHGRRPARPHNPGRTRGGGRHRAVVHRSRRGGARADRGRGGRRPVRRTGLDPAGVRPHRCLRSTAAVRRVRPGRHP